MKTASIALLLLTATAGAPAAFAAEPAPASVREEVRRDMADARQEVRAEMAKARADLDSDDLSLDNSFRFGSESRAEAKRRRALPPAVITAKGDLRIDDKPVQVDAAQRRQLLDYRHQVIALAKIGIDGGERAAMAALEATDVSMFSLIVGGLTGSLERRVEASAKRHVQPVVLQICGRLPALMASQQALSASLPAFRPYANLEPDDVAECEGDVRDSLAAN